MLGRAFASVALGIELAVACLVSPTVAPADIATTKSRKLAPAFTLKDANGAPVSLADYKGKVVLLNFWATWCHGCQLEIPWFINYQEKYKNGLTVLGVSMDDDWKPVKSWTEEKKVNYPIVLGNQDFAKLYDLGPMPMSVLIDRDGKIADSHSGVVDKDSFENEVRLLLQESKCSAK
jgi:cytochrome c biogenesis protein CcmG/thiol:disulfide interchange protein DsbE